MRKLWFILALSTSVSGYTYTTDIELHRYPLLINFTEPNNKKLNDFETIRYTKVFRWAAKNKKDSFDPKKSFKKNDLPNNSTISLLNEYPSWFIDLLSKENKNKVSKSKTYLTGKANSFGGFRYFTPVKRKVRKQDGRIGYISEKTSIENSNRILLDKDFDERATFAFDPSNFNSDKEHILKIDEASSIYSYDQFNRASIPLAGKEISFSKSADNKYKYRLTCNSDYQEKEFINCKNSLLRHYNTIRNKEEVISEIMNQDHAKLLGKSCYNCSYEPYFEIIDRSGIKDPIISINSKTYIPSEIYKESEQISPSQFFSELFAIDKNFSFLQDNLISSEFFQTMVSRENGRNIPSLNYPNNIFASYHYQEIQKGEKMGSRTLVNPYTACMFHKTQKKHLKNIITENYKALNSNFKNKLKECLIQEHPLIPEYEMENTATIIKLFEKPDHPCSKYILTTGMAIQYGDISSAYNFGKMDGHQSHSAGKCLDVRPMRKINIDRATFLDKINHQIQDIKNEDVINNINNFIPTLFQLSNEYTDKITEKLISNIFHSDLSPDGKNDYPTSIKQFHELDSETKKYVLAEYISYSIDLYNQGSINPAVVEYFKYSLLAIDGTYATVKDENLTDNFISLLKESGVDNNTLAYSRGRNTLGNYSHNAVNEKLGLEETRNWGGHNNHIHFCYDYELAEELILRLLETHKNFTRDRIYISKSSINKQLNQNTDIFEQKNYFDALEEKVECLKHIPSELNEIEKSSEIQKLLNI